MKMKPYVGGVLIILVLLVGLKLLFESYSSQYPVAVRGLLEDKRVSAAIGNLDGAFLIGYSFRGSANWGCATLTFLAFGEKQYGWVSVRLQRTASQEANWTYFDSAVGAEDFRIDCRTGRAF